MKYKFKRTIPILLVGVMLLTACGTSGVSVNENKTTASEVNQAATTENLEMEEASDYFSDKDLSTDIDMSEAIYISMSGNTIQANSDKVSVDGQTLTIKEEGCYILSGELEDGMVIIDAASDEKIDLVLDGVSINSKSFAPIYIKEADKVFITLSDGKENKLTNGGDFTQIDDNKVDAVIYSKNDITLKGSGTLVIESPSGHGIVGKDEVTITGGNYTITCAKTAIKANDLIAIADGSFTLNANSDGLHSENDEDESLGNIYIKNGSFDINAGDDGIHATTTLVIDGGSMNIKAVEGLEATNITINDGDIYIEASDDGINASRKSSLYDIKITFNGGNTTIVMGEGDTDGVDANGDIEINGGTIDVTGNSAFDFDNSGVLNAGTVTVNGEVITELTNQMMGGGPGGNHRGPKEMGERPDNMDGNPPSFDGERPKMPDDSKMPDDPPQMPADLESN